MIWQAGRKQKRTREKASNTYPQGQVGPSPRDPHLRQDREQYNPNDNKQHNEQPELSPSSFPLVLVRRRQLAGCLGRVRPDGGDVALNVVCPAPQTTPQPCLPQKER